MRSNYTVASPKSLKQALKRLASNPDLVPIAGCTDICVEMHFGSKQHGPDFLNLWQLSELREVSSEKKESRTRLRIGALATFTDLQQSKAVRKHLPILCDAARQVGGVQIQNRATVGGNIANASPAGDSLPIFSALNAGIRLQSASSERLVPFNDFYTGYRKSVRKPDELIVAIECDIPKNARQYYRKVGTRAAQAISKIVVAGLRSDDGVALSWGSMAATVVRTPKTEKVLAKDANIEGAQSELAEELHPIDDIRSTANYRIRTAQNLLADFWQNTQAP